MLNKQSFETDQEVRWCPGCGDYAILASMQKFLPELNISPHQTVFISGIGCSSRFPYYMNTYGFHTIHGRAPTIATGLSVTRPDLSIWLVTGDGDALSIGANHLLHLMRRNVNVKVLLFNNRIYGLTKGQYSPTSLPGTLSKSTPEGSTEMPLNPIALALAANCSFVARAIDVDSKGLHQVLEAAAQHQGTALIEILQNCHVFNDGTYASFAERAVRDERTLFLKPNESLTLNGEETTWTGLDLGLAMELSTRWWPEHRVPIGIFYAKERPVFEQSIPEVSARAPIESLLKGEQYWNR